MDISSHLTDPAAVALLGTAAGAVLLVAVSLAAWFGFRAGRRAQPGQAAGPTGELTTGPVEPAPDPAHVPVLSGTEPVQLSLPLDAGTGQSTLPLDAGPEMDDEPDQDVPVADTTSEPVQDLADDHDDHDEVAHATAALHHDPDETLKDAPPADDVTDVTSTTDLHDDAEEDELVASSPAMAVLAQLRADEVDVADLPHFPQLDVTPADVVSGIEAGEALRADLLAQEQRAADAAVTGARPVRRRAAKLNAAIDARAHAVAQLCEDEDVHLAWHLEREREFADAGYPLGSLYQPLPIDRTLHVTSRRVDPTDRKAVARTVTELRARTRDDRRRQLQAHKRSQAAVAAHAKHVRVSERQLRKKVADDAATSARHQRKLAQEHDQHHAELVAAELAAYDEDARRTQALIDQAETDAYAEAAARLQAAIDQAEAEAYLEDAQRTAAIVAAAEEAAYAEAAVRLQAEIDQAEEEAYREAAVRLQAAIDQAEADAYAEAAERLQAAIDQAEAEAYLEDAQRTAAIVAAAEEAAYAEAAVRLQAEIDQAEIDAYAEAAHRATLAQMAAAELEARDEDAIRTEIAMVAAVEQAYAEKAQRDQLDADAAAQLERDVAERARRAHEQTERAGWLTRRLVRTSRASRARRPRPQPPARPVVTHEPVASAPATTPPAPLADRLFDGHDTDDVPAGDDRPSRAVTDAPPARGGTGRVYGGAADGPELTDAQRSEARRLESEARERSRAEAALERQRDRDERQRRQQQQVSRAQRRSQRAARQAASRQSRREERTRKQAIRVGLIVEDSRDDAAAGVQWSPTGGYVDPVDHVALDLPEPVPHPAS